MFVRRLVIVSALIAGAVQLQVAASESVIRESVGLNEKKIRSDMSSAAAQLRADAPITTTSSSDIDSLNTKSSSALVLTDESSVPSKVIQNWMNYTSICRCKYFYPVCS